MPPRPLLSPIALAAFLAGLFVLSTPQGANAQSFGVAFGAATELAGGQLLVGEPNSVRRPGRIYVFEPAADGWTQSGLLTADDGTPGDRFGEAISHDGERIVVGASRADGGRGAAYVFERRDGTWQQTAKLALAEDQASDQLGVAVALEGDLALVGTEDGPLLSMAGLVEGFVGPASVDRDASAVHAFRLGDGGTWPHAGQLAPEGEATGIGFGHALALHDGAAYVGASKYGENRAGAVFVFEPAGDSWSRASMITGTSPGAGLGTAVTVTGDGLLVVGAPLQDQQQGQALAFQRDAATGQWTKTASLRPEGQVAHFGATLAVDGADLWIGALGRAFRTSHDAATGAWIETAPIEIERTVGTEFFATAVDLSGDLGAVGFPEDAFGAGTATVLTTVDGGWQVAGSVSGESDAPPAVRGDDVRCEEGDAVGYPCESVDLLSFVPVTEISSERGVHVNDIWGWTDPETGHEWALVGRGDGTAFVDVTNPNDPVYVAEMLRTEGSRAAVWRDIKTLGHYALVVADGAGAHGMQIFDLTRLRDLGPGPTTVEPDVTYDGFGSAHNVIVNESTGFAYAVTGQCGGGLHMVDLSDPLNPVGAGCFTRKGDSPLESSTHDSQCVAYSGPDAAYRDHDVCFTSGFSGLMISDMTDHGNPVMLGIGQVPDAALPHQGWLTEDQRYFLLGDEGDEIQGLAKHTRTLIWDVTELGDPVLLTEYFGPTKAIDHNMYVRGDLVFQANYDAGLRVIDISDIQHPREVGYFDTVPDGPDEASFRMGAWSVYPFFESGTIIVSSGKEGLFVLRYTPKPVS